MRYFYSAPGLQFLPPPLWHPYGEHKPNSQGGHKHDESSRLSKEKKIIKSIKIKAAQFSKLVRPQMYNFFAMILFLELHTNLVFIFHLEGKTEKR